MMTDASEQNSTGPFGVPVIIYGCKCVEELQLNVIEVLEE